MIVRSAVESVELDLEGRATAMNMHDRADVAGLQIRVGSVHSEHDTTMFGEHHLLRGCAVTSRGWSSPDG